MSRSGACEAVTQLVDCGARQLKIGFLTKRTNLEKGVAFGAMPRAVETRASRCSTSTSAVHKLRCEKLAALFSV
jgi:hypothetical protein